MNLFKAFLTPLQCLLSSLVTEGGKQMVTAFAESKHAAGFVCLFVFVVLASNS